MRSGLPDPLRIVVTGAGAPGIRGTLFSLRHNPDDHPVEIVGTDIRADCVGRHLVERFFPLPAPESPAYLDELAGIVAATGAHLVLPQTSREVLILSRNLDRVREMGVTVAVSEPPTVERADSKWTVLETCREAGIPAPRGVLAGDRATFLDAVATLGYPAVPVVAKLPHSNGMRGLRVISEDAWDVGRFVGEKPSGVEVPLDSFVAMVGRGGPWPELLVSEYLPGPEYTVDVFRGDAGARAVVRSRDVIRSGITFEGTVIPGSPLEAVSCALAERLSLRYAFGFQWKEDASGRPCILECNPRVQGTMVAATLAGVNIVWLAVREALGAGPSREELAGAEPIAITFTRFWGGGAERDGRFVEI